MNDLALRIETHLQATPGWVSASELAHLFGVNPRRLRAVGRKPGLLDGFAISSPEGYKHIRQASQEEFDQIRGGLRAHAFAELRKVLAWEQARHNQLTGPRAFLTEKLTGQGVMPL